MDDFGEWHLETRNRFGPRLQHLHPELSRVNAVHHTVVFMRFFERDGTFIEEYWACQRCQKKPPEEIAFAAELAGCLLDKRHCVLCYMMPGHLAMVPPPEKQLQGVKNDDNEQKGLQNDFGRVVSLLTTSFNMAKAFLRKRLARN